MITVMIVMINYDELHDDYDKFGDRCMTIDDGDDDDNDGDEDDNDEDDDDKDGDDILAWQGLPATTHEAQALSPLL